ncbi:MAG: phosphomethylpyrimidine synthase ThiC, partial [Candidatus Saccharicenans sp.]
MTLIEKARKGIISPLLRRLAKEEQVSLQELLTLIAAGKVVVPYNQRHSPAWPTAIGLKMRTKVNVNLGTSRDYPDLKSEIAKLKISLKFRTDAIMDLSTGGDIKKIRRKLLDLSPVPLGTVPVYQAAIEAIARRGSIVKMTADDLFSVIESQAEEGVDFMTVHCGLTLKAIERLKKQGRIADIVSRGGAFHLAWMLHQNKENPLYSGFDRLLQIARKYDITLSLGDGLRPGSVLDATDRPQIEELLTLGELVKRAREA